MGIAIMVTGVLYWAGWRILLPKVFGYELVPRKETLDDGTVITLVSLFSVCFSILLASHYLDCSSLVEGYKSLRSMRAHL